MMPGKILRLAALFALLAAQPAEAQIPSGDSGPAPRAPADSRSNGHGMAGPGVPSVSGEGAIPVPGDAVSTFRLAARGLWAPAVWSTAEWLAIPAGAAALAGLSVADDDVAGFARSHRDSGFGSVLTAVEPFGQEYSWVVIGGLYAGGLVLGRSGLRRTAVEATAASFLSGAVTATLKLVVGRARPRQELGSYAFDPFSGDESFPSGHATQAFAVASVIAARAEPVFVDVLAYGLAAGVAAARIHDDGHYLTDVLAGAAIGTVAGRGIVALAGGGGGVAAPVVTTVDGRLALGLVFAAGSAPSR